MDGCAGAEDGEAADDRAVADGDGSEGELHLAASVAVDEMRNEADASAENDVVADVKEGAIADDHAGSPVSETSDARAPEAEPERVYAGNETEDFFESGEAIENDLELEERPPAEEGGTAEGNGARKISGGEDDSGDQRGKEVERGDGEGELFLEGERGDEGELEERNEIEREQQEASRPRNFGGVVGVFERGGGAIG